MTAIAHNERLHRMTAYPAHNPLSAVLAHTDAIRRLLIVGASPVTRHHPAPMPAIQRYEGSDYRFLRRARSEGALADTQLLILSAQYGLLRPDQPIRDDGRRMTPERAAELAPAVSCYLIDWLMLNPNVCAVLVNVTSSAGHALPEFAVWCSLRQLAYTQLAGTARQRLHQMRAWLLLPPTAIQEDFHVC